MNLNDLLLTDEEVEDAIRGIDGTLSPFVLRAQLVKAVRGIIHDGITERGWSYGLRSYIEYLENALEVLVAESPVDISR